MQVRREQGWAATVLAGALLPVLLAGCASAGGSAAGSGSGSGADSPRVIAPTAGPPSASGPVTVEPLPTPTVLPATLAVDVDPTGSGGVTSWTLTCDPAGGTHPDPLDACLALGAVAGRAALEPVPAGVACAEIWGGPQTATITGELDGGQVDAQLSRANGCEIARWDALVPVLGTAGGA